MNFYLVDDFIYIDYCKSSMQAHRTINIKHRIVSGSIIFNYMDIIRSTYKIFMENRLRILNIVMDHIHIETRVDNFCNNISTTDTLLMIHRKNCVEITSSTILGFIVIRQKYDESYNAYMGINFVNIASAPNTEIFDIMTYLLIVNKKLCISKSIAVTGYSHIYHDQLLIEKLKDFGAQMTKINEIIDDDFQDPNINCNTNSYVKVILSC